MPGGVVCYIERGGGGAVIRRLRLVGAGVVRQWTAPERSLAPDEAGPGVAAARAGARWIAEALSSVGVRRLAGVCVDADGAVCAWLSAPSPDPSVVQATIAQSAAESDGSGAGVGAARLLAMSAPDGAAGLAGDTSVQALATIDPNDEAAAPRRALSLRRPAAATPGAKHRYAVLAVPDAPVRVLLDELDALGVEVACALSLWHALASAWDAGAGSRSSRVVASDAPPAAVLMVDPAGSLVWAWTREGELVAGGAMRLATRARGLERDAAGNSSAASDGLITAQQAAAAKNPSPPADAPTPMGPGEDVALIDFTPADAGRLTMDWLAWSAQLGHCPRRVVCLSVPTLTGGPDAGSGGPEALARNLARVWPNATIDGAVHQDPVGATLARLAGLGAQGDDPAPAPADASALPVEQRPRAVLTGLSSRPGRADRRLYQWVAAALAAGALVVGALGWKVQQSSDDARAAAADLSAQRLKLLKDLESRGVDPTLSKTPFKAPERLNAALGRLREQAAQLKPPRPYLTELVRVLTALKGVNDGVTDPEPAAPGEPPAPSRKTLLSEIDMSPVAASVKLTVPDAVLGPQILDRLQHLPGQLPWEGVYPATFTSTTSGRAYTLTALWPTTPPPAATPAKPPR
jgi:hypothetical protein